MVHWFPPLEDKFPLYTREGWKIPKEAPLKLDPEKVKIQANELKRWIPGIEIRSFSTFPYNCMGLVFASRRAWIEIDHVYKILKDDGYRQIGQREVTVGDIVLYKLNGEPSHIGLIIAADPVGLSRDTLNIKVLSKWGLDAEFIHFIGDVPAQLGQPSEFYTERISE